jgi:hypothetical protein
MKVYITFGQIHKHQLGDIYLNKDCIAEFTTSSINKGHNIAMELFKGKFHNCTSSPEHMEYYPRGIINIDSEIKKGVHNMPGLSNLPPGVTDSMLPGNRPEDLDWDAFHEQVDTDCDYFRFSPLQAMEAWKTAVKLMKIGFECDRSRG